MSNISMDNLIDMSHFEGVGVFFTSHIGNRRNFQILYKYEFL